MRWMYLSSEVHFLFLGQVFYVHVSRELWHLKGSILFLRKMITYFNASEEKAIEFLYSLTEGRLLEAGVNLSNFWSISELNWKLLMCYYILLSAENIQSEEYSGGTNCYTPSFFSLERDC